MKRLSYNILAGSFVIMALGLVMGIFYWEARRVIPEQVMAQDIRLLQNTFTAIHETCFITHFDEDVTIIDFLNVGSFTGSKIGGMNLKHPQRWSGPYVSTNPTIRERAYVIRRTADGHYITPADGIRLPASNQVIGVDLVIDNNTVMAPLIKPGGPLHTVYGELALPMVSTY